MAFIETLKNIIKEGNVIEKEPMNIHSSFKTGGNADYFVSPSSAEETAEIIKAAKKENIPYLVIGNGSNILVSDKGIRGVVIQIGKGMAYAEGKDGKYIIGAGTLLSSAASKICEDGYTGFEFASGIPGSFGGALYMNAGAYGGEMKDVVKWVKVIDENLEVKILTNEEMAFGYRKSIATEKKYIITEGCIELKKGNKEEIAKYSAELNAKRREKQPLNYPSAGSTFKRPEGYFAGKLIEDSGLKGYSVGGACVSEKHAGFVVNKGGATTEDVLEVIKHCQDVVYEKFGVKLETEVKIVGEF